MARRKLEERLIDREQITEQMVLVKGSLVDYITPSGQIYKDYGNNKFFPRKKTLNKANGYLYTNLTIEGKTVQRRLHRLVAEHFLENPNNYPYVGHKDNNKANCHVDNLYWTTASENTKKAYDDGLARNAKGYEDSQSKPIYVFDLQGKLVASYGSISEASKDLGITKTGISMQCRNGVRTKPRCGYYFKFQSDCDGSDLVL